MIQTKHTLKTKRVTGKIGPAVQKKEKKKKEAITLNNQAQE